MPSFEINAGANCEKSHCQPNPLREVLNFQVGGTHYQTAIQPVEYITANNLPFLEGNIVKRVTRHAYKDGLQDILKAIQELTFIAAYSYGTIVRFDVVEQK